MPKKPDRFERAVEKHVHTNQWDMPVIYAHRAAKLLRAEHVWIRRQIEEIDRVSSRKDADISPSVRVGMAAVLDDLEHRLAQRRK